MKNKRLILLSAFLLNIRLVAAQSLEGAFSSLANLGLIGSFTAYPEVWDAIIVFTLFIVLGQNILGKHFERRGAGGAIGFAMGGMAIGGMQYLEFSFVRDIGPWVVIIALIGSLIWVVRMFMTDENKGKVGALGIFLITTPLVHIEQIAQFLMDTSGLVMTVITIAHIIAAVMSAVWLITSSTSSLRKEGESEPGGFGRSLGNAADSINSIRDGKNKLKDAITGKKDEPVKPEDVEELKGRVARFSKGVSTFGNNIRYVKDAMGADNLSGFLKLHMIPEVREKKYKFLLEKGFPHLHNAVKQLKERAKGIIESDSYDQLDEETKKSVNQSLMQFANNQGELAKLLA